MKREREEKQHTDYPIVPVVLGEVQSMEELERWVMASVPQSYRITPALCTYTMFP